MRIARPLCADAGCFVQMLGDKDFTAPTTDMDTVGRGRVRWWQQRQDNDSDDNDGSVACAQYQRLCGVLSELCSQENEALVVGSSHNGSPPTELLDLLTSVCCKYRTTREQTGGYADFDFTRRSGRKTR